MEAQNLQTFQRLDRNLSLLEKVMEPQKIAHAFYQIPDITNSLHFRAHDSIHLEQNIL